ncbi:hypothetical protein JXA84_01665 [candidate division WOR-3 bacterium]|nr:hypothetical protein [candidate division WOR-3 bacterium]
MGDKLEAIYKIVEEHGGTEGRLLLAKKSGLSMSQAKAIEDKQEFLDRMKKIAEEILKRNIDEYLRDKLG